jgi:hypothetical protein
MSERKPKGVKSAFGYSQKIYDDVKDPHGQTATDRIPRAFYHIMNRVLSTTGSGLVSCYLLAVVLLAVNHGSSSQSRI